MKTIFYMNAVQSRYGLTSDYQLAHKLGLSKSNISSMRLGKSFLGEESAIFVAQLLELPPPMVVAHANAERAARAKNSSLLAVYLSIAEKFTPEPAEFALT